MLITDKPLPPATRQLDAWLRGEHGRIEKMARCVRVSRFAIHKWRCGISRPGTGEMRAAVEAATGGAVRADDWTLPAERERAEQLRAITEALKTAPQEP